MKDIIGYEGLYKICSDGAVISCAKKWVRGFKKETKIKARLNKHGYMQVVLQLNKKCSTVLVHRLVAVAFIPNPDNKPQVNHKDGDKLNNNDWNLEWNTRSENIKHAYSIGLKNQTRGKNPNAKKVINLITNELFECVDDARINTKYSYNYFYQMLNGTYKNKTDFIFYKNFNHE